METENIIQKLKESPVRMSMYTFLFGIANVADPKIKDVFVEAYAKTFISELYGTESVEFRAEAVKEIKAFIAREIKKRMEEEQK